ncbi:MAG: DegV family protein [Firmicutes bacterium]|nr:DegV family protein [Candidatus Fiminaster equi]
MNKVQIICDSTIDITQELCQKYGIDVIPLHVSFGDEDYLDGQNITLEQLYAKVKEYGELPHTAAVSSAIFEEEFKKFIDKGMDVVYVGIGSTLSSAFQSAYIAKQSFPDDRVALIDSKNLSTASAILAIKAAKLRDEGKSAVEIAEEVQKLVPNVVGQFSIEQFEYLHKGGRCSGAAKVVGTLLHIRPFLRVIDGKLLVYKKPRGPMKVAINEQINGMKEDAPNIDETVVFITHTGMAPGMVEWVQEEVGKIVDPKSIVVTTAGAVIGSHCGPGTLGIIYLKK